MRTTGFALGVLLLCSSALGASTSVEDVVALGATTGAPKETEKKALSDSQIKKILIEASISAYPGNCPCPYNTAKNGSRCGGRSAWSRAGGAEPLCYPNDVSAQMVQQYRAAHPDN